MQGIVKDPLHICRWGKEGEPLSKKEAEVSPREGGNRLTMLCGMGGEDAVGGPQGIACCPEAGASVAEGGETQRAPGGTVPTRGGNRLTMLPEGGAPGSLKISASSHSVNIILVPRVGTQM